MKPFKAKTKNGEKWYVMNGSSLVEVAAADVPGIVARVEKAEREEASASVVPGDYRYEKPDNLKLMALAGMGMSFDARFPNEKIDVMDDWSM